MTDEIMLKSEETRSPYSRGLLYGMVLFTPYCQSVFWSSGLFPIPTHLSLTYALRRRRQTSNFMTMEWKLAKLTS